MKVNKLSCKDLMVGDWVKIKTYGISDKFERPEAYIYVKVAEIGSCLITIEHNNDIKAPYRICENTEIEPIPLTAEILEKNGFVIDDEWYIYTGQGVNIDVAFRDDNKFVYDLSILTGSGSMDIHAKYVHELQHALRLCGITHEIIL